MPYRYAGLPKRPRDPEAAEPVLTRNHTRDMPISSMMDCQFSVERTRAGYREDP